MRISSDKNDSGFQEFQQLRGQLFVYVDGVIQKLCVTADDVEGMAVVADLDADGKYQADEEGNLKVKTIHGEVTFEEVRCEQ